MPNYSDVLIYLCESSIYSSNNERTKNMFTIRPTGKMVNF
ncbi:hypothetical protein IMSAGC006_00857 [Muribaculaceae bacterium]|nr:hypothetical protein IMSAGC006_00857 [Muribaculaceae bacterium]